MRETEGMNSTLTSAPASGFCDFLVCDSQKAVPQKKVKPKTPVLPSIQELKHNKVDVLLFRHDKLLSNGPFIITFKSRQLGQELKFKPADEF